MCRVFTSVPLSCYLYVCFLLFWLMTHILDLKWTFREGDSIWISGDYWYFIPWQRQKMALDVWHLCFCSQCQLFPFQGRDLSNSIHNWLTYTSCAENVVFTTASRFCFVSLYSPQNGLLVGSSWHEALCSRIPGEFSSWWKIYLCIVNGWKAVSCL